MTKTLKEIRRGEEEFEQKFIGNSMLDLFGHEGSPKNLREHHNQTLRNTLTALKEEVGEKESLQDVQVLLDEIISEI